MKTHAALSLIRAASLALALAPSSACAVPWQSPGPKDFGGTYMILAVKADASAVERAVAQASGVIKARCDSLGVYCKIERQGGEGSNRIKLRVSPGAQDFERVKSVLLAEGKFELRPVVSEPHPASMKTYPTREAAEFGAGPDSEVVSYEGESTRQFLLVEREPVLSGPDLRDVRAEADTHAGGNNYSILFGVKPEAASRFGEWTDRNFGRYLAVVLNGKTRSAPSIRGRITDSGQITGGFTKQQAEDVALTLRSGSLPAPIEVIEEGQYKP